jgi:hypothetical protein
MLAASQRSGLGASGPGVNRSELGATGPCVAVSRQHYLIASPGLDLCTAMCADARRGITRILMKIDLPTPSLELGVVLDGRLREWASKL